jgi:hypothetical protein
MVMVRLCAAVVAALVLSLGVRAQEEKQGRKVTGTFESYKDGTLTLKVDGKNAEFKVPADFKTTLIPETGEARAVPAQAGFQNVRPGTPVEITLGEGDKMAGVTIGKKR